MEYILWLSLVIGTLVLICKKLSFSKLETTLITIFFLLSPFQLEHFGSLESFHFWVLIVGLYILSYIRAESGLLHLAETLIFIGLPFFWMNSIGSSSKDYNLISSNIFSLFSLEFIFFRNTLFAKSNALGVFFPESILLFFVGLFQLLDNKYNSLLVALSVSIITSFFISDSLFAIAPISWFSILIGLGIKKLIHMYKEGNIGIKLALLLYGLIVLFGEIESFHYILVHYALKLVVYRSL